MSSTGFEEELKQRVSFAENVLEDYMPKEEGYARVVIEAMNYSLTAGGKRLRPIMMLESFRLFAGGDADTKVLHPFMAAMEMIQAGADRLGTSSGIAIVEGAKA